VKIYRVIRWVVLASSTITFFLLLKKPTPIARPLDAAALATNMQSYESKMQELQQARTLGQSQTEIRLTADEVSAAITQAGVVPAIETPAEPASPPTSVPAAGPADLQPKVNDYQVSFQGDVARGQFSTEIEGKQVYVTLAGHLGAKDGYVTFDPTEFKVGDLSIPVSIVNPKLQQRLQEQRDRLQLPDFIRDLRVENGQLVIQEK
jgi:hypothetical protein